MSKRFAIFDNAAKGAGLEVVQGGLVLTTTTDSLTTARMCRGTVPMLAYVSDVHFLPWGAGSISQVAVGVCTADASLSSVIGSDEYAIGYYPATGVVACDGVTLDTLATAALDDEIALVLDRDAQTLEVRVSGASIGSVEIPSGLQSEALYWGASLGSTTEGDLSIQALSGQRQPLFPIAGLTGWWEASDTPAPVRLATRHYITRGTDTPANARYEGGLGPLKLRRALHFPIWGRGGSQASTAQVRIHDGAGRFDALCRAGVRDLPARIRVGDTTEALSAATDVGRLVFDRAEVVDDAAKLLVFRSVMSKLDAVLQRRMIPPNATEANANRPWPIVLGKAPGAQPVLIHEGDLRYAIHDAPLQGLSAVRDAGDPLDPTASEPDYVVEEGAETITLHAAPVGTLTVDVSSVGGGISTGSGDLLDGDTETGLDRWDDSYNVTVVSGDLRFNDSYTLAQDFAEAWVKKSAIIEAGASYRLRFTITSKSGFFGGTGQKARLFVANGVPAFATLGLAICTEPGSYVVTLTNHSASAWDLYLIMRGTQSAADFIRIADASLELVRTSTDEAPEDDLEPITLTAFAREVLEHRGEQLTLADYAQEDLQAIDTATGFRGIGYYETEPTTPREAMDAAMVGYMACLYEDRAGIIRATRLEPPETLTPEGTITRRDLLKMLDKRVDPMEGLTTHVAYRRNWHVFGDRSELANDPVDVPLSYVREVTRKHRRLVTTGAPLAPAYRKAELQEPLETLLDHPADAASCADHMASLAAVERAFYTILVPDGTLYELGECWTLQYPRYGLDEGIPCIVVEILEDPVTREAEITLWGRNP